MSGLGAIYDITVAALRKHSATLSRLQEQASTSTRIIRSSDSPSEAYQVMGLDAQKQTLDTYLKNIDSVGMQLNQISSVLENLSASLTSTRQLASQAANGTYSQNDRAVIGAQVDQLLEGMLSLVNSQSMGRYLFSGSAIFDQPYVVTRKDGQITSASYQGSPQDLPVPVADGVDESGVLAGSRIFSCSQRQTPVFLGNTGARPGSGTSTACGDVWLRIEHDAAGLKMSIDDGATYTPVDFSANQAVADSRSGKILYVDTSGVTQSGLEPVRVSGTYDLFNMMIGLRDLLMNKQGLTGQQQADLLGEALDSINEVTRGVTQGITTLGAKQAGMDTLRQTIETFSQNTKAAADSIRDVDIAELTVELTRSQTFYQMTLAATAKVLNVSLLDYL